MVVGAIFAICVTGTNPSKVVNEFFNGCGKGFANIVSIIISASVFAMGLRASGLVGDMIEVLKTSNEYARWFGILGPYFMAILVGSGDAATMAFNEAVTPHAATFGKMCIRDRYSPDRHQSPPWKFRVQLPCTEQLRLRFWTFPLQSQG